MQIKPTLKQDVAYHDLVKHGLVFGNTVKLEVAGVVQIRVTQFVNQIRFEQEIGNNEWNTICRIWIGKTTNRIKRIFTPFQNHTAVDQVRKLIDVYSEHKLKELGL